MDDGCVWNRDSRILQVCLKENPLIAAATTIIETTNLAESVRLYSSVGAVPVRFGVRSVIINWFDKVIELREKPSYVVHVRI